MMQIFSHIYQSDGFFPDGWIHGFSTRYFGDMREDSPRHAFLAALGIKPAWLIGQEQLHTDRIVSVTAQQKGTVVPGVDGLVHAYHKEDKSIVLAVKTADCVPILAGDPVGMVLGVAHAGWRGTLAHIGRTLIRAMCELGSSASDIRVVIGPHICSRCYVVGSQRAQAFENEFFSQSVVLQKKGKFFLDMGKANWSDLISAGILPTHIAYDRLACTYENRKDFYSFRGNKNHVDGEIMGVIGICGGKY